MKKKISGKYYMKKRYEEAWHDVTTLFDGVNILSISGLNEVGEAKNIYNEQWINSQEEDFMVTTQDMSDKDVVIRSNVDLTMTFIVGTRYSTNNNIDTQDIYNVFVDYICNNGDFYIYSSYSGKLAHVTCIKGVKPTVEKLHRGAESYIMATATLHTLEKPVNRKISGTDIDDSLILTESISGGVFLLE